MRREFEIFGGRGDGDRDHVAGAEGEKVCRGYTSVEKDLVVAFSQLIRRGGYFGTSEMVTNYQRLIFESIIISEGTSRLNTIGRKVGLLP